jgi:site-specific recombinase XerD
MRQAARDRHGQRLNALIVVLWRAGLRINEALSLTESDLDQRRGSILVRHGKNDRRREVGMEAWRWTALEPWLAERVTLPVGSLSA